MRLCQGPIVVALGGNAISPNGCSGDVERQIARTRRTAAVLADLVADGRRLVVTHGNGPQVGSALRRVELAAHEVYPLPLDICVADTQGGMGYIIARCLGDELRRRGSERGVCAIITTVEVAADDPALSRPEKPIGPAYDRDRAEQLTREHGWDMVKVNGGGFRRVVPSPTPLAIREIGLIRRLVEAGELPVVCGGGGVPVVRTASGDSVGIEAVIDKDRTSALLAERLQAEALIVATDVEGVMLDFDTPAARVLDRLTVSQAREYLAAGQFPPGSMGPKIEAAIGFLERSTRGAARFMICDLDRLPQALAGRCGTCITRDEPPPPPTAETAPCTSSAVRSD